VGCATMQAVSRGYNINTKDITCEDANRYVQESLADQKMTITEFRKARPGSPGLAKARREDARGGLSGTISTTCDDQGVHVIPNETGFSTTRDFERGVFLSFTGRADLVVEREGRYSTGNLHKRKPTENTRILAQADTGKNSPASDPTPASTGGVGVHLELIRGFATVLDFEANVAAVAILPIKVSVENKTARIYDFNPQDVILRKKGSREAAQPLSAREAVERLQARAGAEERSGDLGDVAAAVRILPEKEIKPARLKPGASVAGYMYFPEGDYDRARVTMTDVATGETEGFMVEF
jgi:hypothetical protein